MIDDLDEFRGIVARLKDTTEHKWVPVLREADAAIEEAGDRLT